MLPSRDFILSAVDTTPLIQPTTTYNANNQQTAFGTTTETYDLNGNLATFTDASGTTTYSWNARNQLVSLSGPSLTATFTYDSFGRRTGKTINATTTNFVYDGLNPVQEKNGATVTANLLTGLGIDEFFTRTDGVGVRSLLPDALGSTVALGDGTGTLQTQYTYEPFGASTQTGAASTSSYKFTGREDDGTGLMYYRARYYQSRLQRFISEDPIGLEGGINYYAYVGNNPNRWIDPMGLESEFPPGNSPPDDSIEEIDLTQSIPGPKSALLLALSTKQAIEGAANACKNIRCKIQLHPPHHYFGWPFNKQMRHIELICYIKGVKGSQFILRFPY